MKEQFSIVKALKFIVFIYFIWTELKTETQINFVENDLHKSNSLQIFAKHLMFHSCDCYLK